MYRKRCTCIHAYYYIQSLFRDRSRVLNRSTRRVRVVCIHVTSHPAHMATSRAHNASALYISCRSSTFMIVPFNCDLTQHLNRPDARTRVRERGLSFSQSPKFNIFIISRNLRSKIKNRLPKRFAHMFTDSRTGLIVSRFLLRFELLIDLHGPLSPKSYRFFTLPSITGI